MAEKIELSTSDTQVVSGLFGSLVGVKGVLDLDG